MSKVIRNHYISPNKLICFHINKLSLVLAIKISSTAASKHGAKFRGSFHLFQKPGKIPETRFSPKQDIAGATHSPESPPSIWLHIYFWQLYTTQLAMPFRQLTNLN